MLQVGNCFRRRRQEQSIWSTAKSTTSKFAITSCANRPTARAYVRRSRSKSATTAGKCRLVRTRVRASGATAAAGFTWPGSPSAARKKKRAFTTACPKTTAKASRRAAWCTATPRRRVLYNNLIVGDDDTVYLAWSNLDADNRAQIFMRTHRVPTANWSPIQQVSNAKGDASRPVLALTKESAARRLDGNRRRELARRHAQRKDRAMKIVTVRTKPAARPLRLSDYRSHLRASRSSAVKSNLSQRN